jgi:serine/threonine protein kinase
MADQQGPAPTDGEPGQASNPRRECLTADELLTYTRRSVPAAFEASIRSHLHTCAACCVVVAAAVRSVGGGDGDVATAPAGEAHAAAALTLTPGEVLLERYRIVRFLARGGMGEVYETYDSVLHETVALKTLVCTALDSPAALQRFMGEVRTARQVTHPNICRILEFGIHRPAGQGSAAAVPFLTMEFLAGETLAKRIAREGRLDPAVVARLLPQMVAGVSAIHAAGIVHRDIKPGNIVLLPGPPERVVVTDFGLARMLDPDPVHGSETGPFLVGTVDYMSPEQIEGKPPTRRFDVYALGVVIFEMLTGYKPFRAGSPVASAVERLRRPAPSPSQFLPGLDRAWDELCGRCLATDPAHRFVRVEDIVAPAVGRRLLGSRRSKLVAGLLGAGALVAGVAALALRPGDSVELASSARRYPPESELAARLEQRPRDAPPARAVRRIIGTTGCSADMVSVAGRFCIDRYEASTVDDVQERGLSPDYPPWAPLADSVHDFWSERLRAGQAGSSAGLPARESFELEDRWRPRAVSRRLVAPQAFVNRPIAAAACASAGKRLCTETEWKTACRGERNTRFPYGSQYQQGICNIYREAHPAIILYGVISGPLDDPRLGRVGFQGRQLLRKTSDPEFERCRSPWGDDGIHDMVGNLDEWVDSPEVLYLGGHHARDTTEGCEYRNARHKKEGGSYFNYSIGFRCCDSIRQSSPSPER